MYLKQDVSISLDNHEACYSIADQIWIMAIDQIWSMEYSKQMESQFLLHNMHLLDPQRFIELDPQLNFLKRQKYVYHPSLIAELPTSLPGVYTLTGGRQVGKSTLLKQWMEKLLEDGTDPQRIAFFSGELIDTHHVLFRLIREQIEAMPTGKVKYLLIDEITYIKDWDKAIKYAADAGLFTETEVILTGSDYVLIKQARMRFPGRRGLAKQVNFHLAPLSFRETLALKNKLQPAIDIDVLFTELNNYLQHGGYLKAINDLAMHNSILTSTLATYSDWVCGDMLKHGKQEPYLREILSAIIKRLGSQISWHVLASDLSIDHHKTVADYIELLVSMEVLFVQSALLEDKLVAAPKKAKKVMFEDPFIFHAVRAWLNPVNNPYKEQILPILHDDILRSKLIEACVITHYHRQFSTFYIKAEGEVDIAYVKDNRFYPVEIKWTNQIRPKDLKQIAKYKNSLILTKAKQAGAISAIPTKPIPLALLDL